MALANLVALPAVYRTTCEYSDRTWPARTKPLQNKCKTLRFKGIQRLGPAGLEPATNGL